jgi:hypothetical protein
MAKSRKQKAETRVRAARAMGREWAGKFTEGNGGNEGETENKKAEKLKG